MNTGKDGKMYSIVCLTKDGEIVGNQDFETKKEAKECLKEHKKMDKAFFNVLGLEFEYKIIEY